jgi:hypothetical protein
MRPIMGRAHAATVIMVMAFVGLGGRAVAQPSGSGPGPADHPAEPGIALGQLLAGGAIGAGATLLSIDSRNDVVHTAWIPATPALVGATVCAVGNLSRDYEGDCLPAIAGAYGGAASVLPLGILGAVLAHKQGSTELLDDSAIGGLIVGMAVGWFVVQPLAATVLWRLYKRPRMKGSPALPVPTSSVAATPYDLVERERARPAAPGQLTLTLFRVSL